MDSTKAALPVTENDIAAFSGKMAEIMERLGPLLQEYAEKHNQSFSTDPLNLQPALFQFWDAACRHPEKIADLQIQYAQNIALLWQETTRKFFGENADDVIRPEQGDKRFRSELWSENAAFDLLKQSYLLTSRLMKECVRNTDGMDSREKARLDFYTRQFIDGMAPTNFAITNPEVLRETLNSKGQNLLNGLENLVEDLTRGQGDLNIKKTDYETYALGKNLALTPGDVVYQNDLMQLIQYRASTKEVYQTPLLIVPPWINKYYILDMRPDNSYVKWAVDQGHTVFIISWVNPDKKLAQKDFASYMEEGVIEALSFIEKAAKTKKTNLVGYCIGGTLLSVTLGWLAAKGQGKRVTSATFLTTLIDFSEAGDLGVFVDDAQLEALEKKMKEKGFLQGSELRHTFSMLRANDLIWSYVINNYMMGKEPFPFDLLYWNDDSTNMPFAMHSFYLRNMYRDNLLRKRGGIKIKNTPIDVRAIQTPSYFLSTKEDHIAPWKSTFESMHLLGGDKTFVLSASGHVAGVVNPPDAKKYHYWSSSKIDDRDYPDQWLEKARQWDGSWWAHWAKWINKHAGPKVPARKVTKSLEAAPGSYVLKKAS